MSQRRYLPVPLPVEVAPAPPRSFARTTPGRAALLAVNLAAVTMFLLKVTPHGLALGPYRIDLDVYRLGARTWLDGGNLYGHLPPTMAGVRLRSPTRRSPRCCCRRSRSCRW